MIKLFITSIIRNNCPLLLQGILKIQTNIAEDNYYTLLKIYGKNINCLSKSSKQNRNFKKRKQSLLAAASEVGRSLAQANTIRRIITSAEIH